MNTDFLWQSGRRVEYLDISPPQDPSSSGLWLGDGLFETMLALKGKIFARRRHIERFEAAALRLMLNQNEFESGLDEAQTWLDGRTGRIRLTQASDGELFIFAREHEIPKNPLTLVLYPNSIEHLDRDLGFKSLSYGFNARALRYAKGQNADDAIFTNHRGEVIESSLANVLVWDGSTWWTPSLDSGCLPGVTRQLLIEYFGVKEKVIKSEELQEVECLALSSSLRGVQAISRFQGISYSSQGEVDRLRQDFANWRERNLNP